MTRLPYRCCCEVYPCTDACSAGVPDELTATISGGANDNCTGWPAVDGSYVIPFVSCTSWSKAFATPIALMEIDSACVTTYGSQQPYGLTVSAAIYGTELRGWISTYGWSGLFGKRGAETHVFTATISSPDDCCFWTGLSLLYSHSSLSYNATDYGGDFSLATMSLTSGAAGC